MQQLVEAPGVAAADEDGVSMVDRVHRVIELMDADGLHPKALAEFQGAGIPVAADHRVGNEQDALDLFAGEQGLHPIRAQPSRPGHSVALPLLRRSSSMKRVLDK